MSARAASRFSRFVIIKRANRLVVGRFCGLMLFNGENRLVANRFSGLVFVNGENRLGGTGGPRSSRTLAERSLGDQALFRFEGALAGGHRGVAAGAEPSGVAGGWGVIGAGVPATG